MMAAEILLQRVKDATILPTMCRTFRKCINKQREMFMPNQSKFHHLCSCNTHKIRNRCNTRGFTTEQAECLTDAFVEVINAAIDHNTKSMITKTQQEIMVQQLLAQIQSVKKDMIILEKSEFTTLRNETEKQTLEIKQLQNSLQNEVSKLRSNVSLDINLERSRATEAHAENEKHLQALHNKIETDVANLKTTYEKYRNEVIKYSAGAVLSCATVAVGIMRLMSYSLLVYALIHFINHTRMFDCSRI